MTTLALILAAFTIGYLLGDRRGTKQANELLDANMRVLLNAAADERTILVDDDGENRPTVH